MRIFLILLIIISFTINSSIADESDKTKQLAIKVLEDKILDTSDSIQKNQDSMVHISNAVSKLEEGIYISERKKERSATIVMVSLPIVAVSVILTRTRIVKYRFLRLIKEVPLLASTAATYGTVTLVMQKYKAERLLKELSVQKDLFRVTQTKLKNNLTRWCTLHEKLAEKKDTEISEEILDICENIE